MRFVFVQKWICSQLMAAWRNGEHDFKEHDILGQTIFKQTPRISVVSITLMVWPHIGPASKLDSPEIPQVGTISAAKIVGLLRCHYDSHLDPELIFLVHHALATPTWLLDSRCSPRKLPCVLGAKTAGDGDGRCHSHGFHGPGYLWWNVWWNARTASDASGEPAA